MLCRLGWGHRASTTQLLLEFRAGGSGESGLASSAFTWDAAAQWWPMPGSSSGDELAGWVAAAATRLLPPVAQIPAWRTQRSFPVWPVPRATISFLGGGLRWGLNQSPSHVLGESSTVQLYSQLFPSFSKTFTKLPRLPRPHDLPCLSFLSTWNCRHAHSTQCTVSLNIQSRTPARINGAAFLMTRRKQK